VEGCAFAKRNRYWGKRKSRYRIPLRPSGPPGFRLDGRNGLPENRRDQTDL